LSIIGILTPQPQTPAQQTQNALPEDTTASANNTQPTSTEAVAPAEKSSDSADSNDATSYSGTGAGAGSQDSSQTTAPQSVPPQASSVSVIEARTTQAAPATAPENIAPYTADLSEDAARQAALDLMERQKTDALIEALKATPEVRDITAPERTSEAEPTDPSDAVASVTTQAEPVDTLV